MSIPNDKVVKMHFVLQDASTKEVLEDNTDFEPIEFLLGRGHILDALEAEIAKMSEGESKEILISAANAWSEYNPELVQVLPKEQFAGLELFVGMELFGENEDGSQVRVSVKDITDSEVTIDYNHPYAGKDLLFNVKIESVRDASADELANGYVAQPGHGGGCCGGGGGGCGCGGGDEHHHGGCGSHEPAHHHGGGGGC